MEKIIPNSFIELLGGVLLIAALIAALVSLFQKNKRPTTKLAGILFVASLCLFSSNGWIYFVGVLIIATAITDLDFIQNVVSAIKGNRPSSESVDRIPGKAPERSIIPESEYRESKE